MGEDTDRKDTQRWGDRAWDVALRVLGVTLVGVCAFLTSRILSNEERIRALEVRAAVVDEARSNQSKILSEIQTDVKAIKAKVGVP